MSADGKIATANRRVTSLGSARDYAHLLALRATVDAVMCGARTADAEPVNLGPGPARYRRLRLRRGLAEYNLRVIVSGTGSLDPNAEVFRHRFSPILILASGRASPRRLARLRDVAEAVRVCGRSTLDLAAGLRWLRTSWKVKRLLCEGGAELNFAMIAAGLVDEVHLTICPKILGGRKAPTIADGDGFDRLTQAARLVLVSRRRVADELFLTFSVRP